MFELKWKILVEGVMCRIQIQYAYLNTANSDVCLKCYIGLLISQYIVFCIPHNIYTITDE
jgi:hypothetical protein